MFDPLNDGAADQEMREGVMPIPRDFLLDTLPEKSEVDGRLSDDELEMISSEPPALGQIGRPRARVMISGCKRLITAFLGVDHFHFAVACQVQDGKLNRSTETGK